MAHSFIILLKEDVSSALRNVETIITGSGGSFKGDIEKGTFHAHTVAGRIKGDYRTLSDREIKITIMDKPFIVPYSMIETEIRKYCE